MTAEELLRASEQELRRTFSKALSKRSDIEAAVQFAQAWQELALAVGDIEREVQVCQEKLIPLWQQHAPFVQTRPVVDVTFSKGSNELLRFTGVSQRSDQSPVWSCLKDQEAVNPFAEKPTVWEELWELYREGRLATCEHCGKPMIRAPEGPEKRYCSSACRAAAWRQRKQTANAT